MTSRKNCREAYVIYGYCVAYIPLFGIQYCEGTRPLCSYPSKRGKKKSKKHSRLYSNVLRDIPFYVMY